MLDLAPPWRLEDPQQAVAHTSFAPTPSGCRQTTWHVVVTKPRAERIAHAALHHRGYNPYLPLLLGRPLFPGYCFLQLGTGQPYYPIAWAPGVYSLISTAGKPNVVARAVISALRAGDELRAVRQRTDASWAPGMPCRAGKGHVFRDLDAVVVSVGNSRAVIAILYANSLQRVNLPISHLERREE